MGVGGDEPGCQDTVSCINRLVHDAIEGAADVRDPLALHDHDAVAEEPVAPAVEGDDPAGADGDASHAAHRATIAGSRRSTA
jgi:hypothetical protein